MSGPYFEHSEIRFGRIWREGLNNRLSASIQSAQHSLESSAAKTPAHDDENSRSGSTQPQQRSSDSAQSSAGSGLSRGSSEGISAKPFSGPSVFQPIPLQQQRFEREVLNNTVPERRLPKPLSPDPVSDNFPFSNHAIPKKPVPARTQPPTHDRENSLFVPSRPAPRPPGNVQSPSHRLGAKAPAVHRGESWTRRSVEPEEVQELLRGCTLELKSRGMSVTYF